MPVDAKAEGDAATNYSLGFTIMPVTAGENWGPNTGEAGYVITEQDDAGGGRQTFVVSATGTSYIRYYTSSAWGSWSSGGWSAVDASETVKGIAELATQTETNTGTDTGRIVTPATLASYTGITNKTPQARTISTTAPLTGGGDLSANRTLAVSQGSETAQGVLELATDAETQTGTDTARAITPANLAARTATETRTGVIEIATSAEMTTGTDDVRAVTPLKARTANDARYVRTVNSTAPDGSGNVVVAGGYRTLARVSGSDVGNLATLNYADVTGLTFAVTSGVHYKFEAILDFVTNATTSGVRFSMNGPTITRGSWFVQIPPASGAAPYVPITNHQVAFDTGAATASVTAVSPNLAILKGFFICSASGTAAVRFASEVATANTLTIKIGSSLEYWSV